MIEIANGPGSSVVCTPTRNLDFEGAFPLRHLIADLVAPGIELIVDLRHVAEVDAIGVSALVGSIRRVRSHRGTVRLRNITPPVRWHLRRLGVYRFVMRDSFVA
jgi:anti-anti-sigma factor